MAPSAASKDLLNLEHKNPSISSLEASLLVCENSSSSQAPKPSTFPGKLVTNSIPRSAVLGKVKDFLGVMAEANTRLQNDAKDKSSVEYDIEALTGNEAEYIEMDLVLGVADLHTPEAVAAAESAIAGSVSVIPLSAANCSGSDTESSGDDDCEDGDCGSMDMDTVSKTDQPKKRQQVIELN